MRKQRNGKENRKCAPYLETCLQTFVYKMNEITAYSEGSLRNRSFRLVASWFFEAFGKPRNKQLKAWPTPTHQKAEKEKDEEKGKRRPSMETFKQICVHPIQRKIENKEFKNCFYTLFNSN